METKTATGEKIPITVVMRWYVQSSHLAWLVGNGPKYFRNIFYKPSEPIWDSREPFQSEHDRHIVLLGHHPKLVEKLKQAHDEYQRSTEEHGRAKERALWEFKDKWAKENPSPTYPYIEKMVGNLPRVEAVASMSKVKQGSLSQIK